MSTIRHTMTNSSSCSSDNSSVGTHRAATHSPSLSPLRPSSHLPSRSPLRLKGRLYDYRHALQRIHPPSQLIVIQFAPQDLVRLNCDSMVVLHSMVVTCHVWCRRQSCLRVGNACHTSWKQDNNGP